MVSNDILGTEGMDSIAWSLSSTNIFPPSFYFLQRVFLRRSVRPRPTIAMITFILVGLSFSFNDTPWYTFLSYFRRSKVRTIRLGGFTEFVFSPSCQATLSLSFSIHFCLILNENNFSPFLLLTVFLNARDPRCDRPLR